MLRTLRHRPSPAMVVALIALFVATAGTATAATKVLIKNSAQVKSGALQASDLSSKARQSLRGNRGPTGPAGPAGAQGPAGAPGARGPSEVFATRPAGLNTPQCPGAGCAPQAVLRTLSLPAGSFVVEGVTDLSPAVPVAGVEHSIECHLTRGDDGTFQRVINAYRTPASGTTDTTVRVSWALTLAAPTTLSLSCAVGNVNHAAANTRITAVQVGALSETVS